MLFNLSEQNSIANRFIAELRDKNIQQDRLRFRRNVERLGQIMAYEISRNMRFVESTVETPLGKTLVNVPATEPHLVTVMRAGLPYFQGFLEFFDRADCGFIGAYRTEGTDQITINLDYVASPSIDDRDLILIDPMLATGKSFIRALDALLQHGTPAHVYVASLIAAPEGIAFLKQNLSIPYSLWTCVVDEKLNNQFYIVPGLGDAGDLSFGQKV